MKRILTILISIAFTFTAIINFQDLIVSETCYADKQIFHQMGKNDNISSDFYSPDELAEDILNYNNIELIKFNMISNDDYDIYATKFVTQSDLLNIESDNDIEELQLDIFIHKCGNHVDLLGENLDFDYSETIEIYFDIDENKISGDVTIVNQNGEYNNVNIFDMDIETEEEISTYFLGITFCGVALWKIVTAVVVVATAISIAAYPDFYVRGLESLCNEFGYYTSKLINKVNYKFTKLVNGVTDVIDYMRNDNNTNTYYLAIPITKDNVSTYSGVEINDMLISEYPVTYSEAKKALRLGYSIYTFEQFDAYKAIKFAWANGYAIDEPCNKGLPNGFYSHYHPYYKSGNKLIKRYVYFEGVLTAIHGFYGYSW